jgi:hypothetical protein
VGWADKPCNAVAVEEIAGEVGAVEDEDVEEEIWSWKASRSFRRALDCLRAWLYSEFMSAEHRPKVPVVRARFRVVRWSASIHVKRCKCYENLCSHFSRTSRLKRHFQMNFSWPSLLTMLDLTLTNWLRI